MEYTVLGRTGLKVSVAGLGTGGTSRMGQGTGRSEGESMDLVLRALDLGVNFIDTAESYANEAIVGRAIVGRRREDVVISTKKTIDIEGRMITPDELAAGLEASLKRLGTDRIDVYHLHGVASDLYPRALADLVPRMQKLRDDGKIRFLGITEAFHSDPGHRTLTQAVRDDCWDVMMVGFNVLNQSARDRVLAPAARNGTGVLIMFAVRKAFSRPERLKEIVADLAVRGKVSSSAADDSLADLVRDGVAVSIPDAAYRFCRHEPGVHVTLFGTGDRSHLEANVESLCRPPLPAADVETLKGMFANVDDVSGG